MDASMCVLPHEELYLLTLFLSAPAEGPRCCPVPILAHSLVSSKTFPSLINRCLFPETAASFPPFTILSSCLPAEASRHVHPMQTPLRPSSALDTHTRHDPSPLPVVHISCATSHSSLEAIPSSSAYCTFSCPHAACMLPVISKETG